MEQDGDEDYSEENGSLGGSDEMPAIPDLGR